MVIKLFRIIALIFLLNLKYDYYILPTRRDEFVITSIWHLKWIRFSLLRQGWKTTLGRIHFITYLHLVISYWTIAYFTQCLTKIIHQVNKCKQVLCMIGFTYFTFKCLWYNLYDPKTRGIQWKTNITYFYLMFLYKNLKYWVITLYTLNYKCTIKSQQMNPYITSVFI